MNRWLIALMLLTPITANADWVLYVKDVPVKTYKDVGQCKAEAWLLSYILAVECKYSVAYSK